MSTAQSPASYERPEKFPDLGKTGAGLYQLRHQANYQAGHFVIRRQIVDIVKIYRGYYTVARRYEFYVRVARTTSHERAKRLVDSCIGIE